MISVGRYHFLAVFNRSTRKLAESLAATSSSACRRSSPSTRASVRHLRTTVPRCVSFFGRKKKKKTDVEKQEAVIVSKSSNFQVQEKKTRDTFVFLLENFVVNNPHRRGHVEFIYACLRNLEDFGLEKDKEIYKKILNVFPKGKMVARNQLQVEFMHFPWQQQCAIDVLSKMEDHGVMPDKDFQYILMEVFGYRSFPMRKLYRMMYWMPKFKHASPFPLPNPVPNDALELARLALKRITDVDAQTKVTTYKTSDLETSVDDTWVVSAQSPTQRKLIEGYPETRPLFVDGAYNVWLRNKSIAYFVLRADPVGPLYTPPDLSTLDDVSDLPVWPLSEDAAEKVSVMLRPSVHEQEDGTYLAAAATGTSSRDSLLSWVRFLHRHNPRLQNIPVVFTLRAPTTDVVPLNVYLDKEEAHQEGETL